jgi:diacylglycerol kinase (ATP)
MSVAVIAHTGKRLGGGLPELRRLLAAEGIEDPIWHEVPKSKRAPREVERALRAAADRILAWGGDGMVRRCLDAIGDSPAELGILPAGTSNLLATNLRIESDLPSAVRTALHGTPRRIDLGRFDGERFGVMAGVGFDAEMIRGSDDHKDRLGRAAYVLSGAANLRAEPFDAVMKVDGAIWYEGPTTCILIGNVGRLFGGIEIFPDAAIDDGRLDIGVVTATGPVQLARTITRAMISDPERSPFVNITQGHRLRVKLSRRVRYELDGGDRRRVREFRVEVEPAAVTVRVPHPEEPR